jgi:hypothetical protein
MADAAFFEASAAQTKTRAQGFKLPRGILEAAIVIAGSAGFALAGALLGSCLMLPIGGS